MKTQNIVLLGLISTIIVTLILGYSDISSFNQNSQDIKIYDQQTQKFTKNIQSQKKLQSETNTQILEQQQFQELTAGKTIGQVVGKCANIAIAAQDDHHIICKNTKKPAHWWYKHILTDESCVLDQKYSAWDRNSSSSGYWKKAWDYIKTQPFINYTTQHRIQFNQNVTQCKKDRTDSKVLSNNIVVIVQKCYLESDVTQKKMPCIFTAYPAAK